MIEMIMAWGAAQITEWGASQIAVYASGSVLAVVVAWILKKIPNEKIYNAVENFFHSVGKWSTLTLSKKSKIWNATIEKWVIDLINNTFLAAANGLIRGLKSDDKDS